MDAATFMNSLPVQLMAIPAHLPGFFFWINGALVIVLCLTYDRLDLTTLQGGLFFGNTTSLKTPTFINLLSLA